MHQYNKEWWIGEDGNEEWSASVAINELLKAMIYPIVVAREVPVHGRADGFVVVPVAAGVLIRGFLPPTAGTAI